METRNRKMSRSKLSLAAGGLLILLGLLIPPSQLSSFVRGIPPVELEYRLLLGARLFKAGLIILGIFVLVLGRLPIWRGEKQKQNHIPGTSRKSVLIVLMIIMAVSVGLNLYKLNSGLWIDEIITYVKYAHMPVGEIITTYDSQNLHPLFTLLARASYALFGAPWSLRLPAVLFGVASLGILYLFAVEVGTRLEAILSAALLAFSYQFIWFSQNARGYTGLLFWTLLSTWLFFRGLREDQPKIWLLYAFAAALGVYTHFTMLFVVLGQFAVYLVELYYRREVKGFAKWTGLLAGFCLAGLLIFQFHALILPQILGQASQEGTRSAVATWKNPFWTALELLRALKNAVSGNFLALAIGVFIFGAGSYDFIRKKPFVVLLMSFPPVIAVVSLKLLGHPIFPRTFFWIIGFAILVVIRGALVVGSWTQRLIHWRPARPNSIGAALCLGLIFMSALSVPRVYGPKQDYQGALSFVEENRQPGDSVITVGFNATFPYQKFYQLNWQEAETLNELDIIRSRSSRTWLIYTISLHFKNEYPEIYGSVQRDFIDVKDFFGTLSDGTIHVCRSDRTPQS
jgi:mannosyltransferase